jgi:SpoVK/Ycf46/Vps4 family AAA+-type ATPase
MVENIDGIVSKVRIKDAFKEDAGRGIVRIDPEIVSNLNLRVGDVIKIIHPVVNKKTVASLSTGKNEDKGKNIIRMDPSLRRNLGASIDDLVEIKKISVDIANTITFTGLDNSLIPRDPQALARKLENRSITKGDSLSFYAMARRIDLVVVDYTPNSEAVKIQLDTKILFSEKSTQEINEIKKKEITYEGISDLEQRLQEIQGKITYEDIGGLEDAIQKIREMIELPIRHPELFERIGIDPPKGVLLHGAPGTGKTLLAKAVAYETDAYFINISGPEIMSKFFGQSEENLRNRFEEAKNNAPSIIFLDELDSIAHKRDENKGQVEARVVAQLLSLMDGLEGRGEVIVIGATNKVNNIDIALRRPGRFDREIEIKVPDTKGRYEVLLIHTRGMPLNEDIDLNLIAEKTHGFVGADMKSRPPNGILMFGLPGTGKTLMAKALAHETEVNFISVKGPEFLSKWVGESAKAVREVFRKARTAAPCIIFFDEIDAIAARRSTSSSSRVIEQVVAQFLTEMDGLEELKDVILIAATNRPDILDPAILRSGRFGRHIEVPLPNKTSRIKIFKIHLANRPIDNNIDIEKLAERLEGNTGADIKAICEEATLLAIRRSVIDDNIDTQDPDSYKKVKISQADFEKAIEKVQLGANKAKRAYRETIKETVEDIYR